MIVTADPVGDFNATSQILRYSALAREITVPRIPSVTSTIIAASTTSHYFNPNLGRKGTGCGRSSPSETERETMEIAALEIARMSEEIDGLRAELIAEQERRMEVEAHLESQQDRALEIEAEVREECYQEMEKRIEQEMRRWKATWAAEADRNDEHLDKKLEILNRMGEVDEEDKENVNKGEMHKEKNGDLEEENERLRREVEMLRREVQGRSPSKRAPLQESRVGRDIGEQMERMSLKESPRKASGNSVNGSGSPVKKVKKLTARKWDLMDEGELL
jgi:hypothetical protein